MSPLTVRVLGHWKLRANKRVRCTLHGNRPYSIAIFQYVRYGTETVLVIINRDNKRQPASLFLALRCFPNTSQMHYYLKSACIDLIKSTAYLITLYLDVFYRVELCVF